jgi:uncharacterized damage-inducible protein DinB
MGEASRIAEQMRRVMVGAAWHGPSVLEALEGLPASAASAHPVPGAHSVWELVRHIDFTQRLLARRLKGEDPPATDADFFPAVSDTSEPAWNAAVAALRTQEEALCAAVATLGDDRLAAPITPSGGTVYETFHGHAQHNAFHAGQIRLLRKLLNA